MSPFSALVLGIIQGITEFLPISSSAHLALTHWITGWTHTPAEDFTFDVALHFGTLLAILVYFGRDWLGFFRRRDRMVLYVLVACIPGAAAGALFEQAAETAFRSPLHIAGLLALMGLALAAAERWGRQLRELAEMRWGDAVWIGLAQALAIMPGVSRSGITISTGLLLGLTRESAARFSFLLSTPIILGATLWKCRHLISGGLGVGPAPLAIGVLASAVTGLACVHFLLRFLRQHTLYPFAIYRLALAAAVVAVVVLRGH